MLVQRYQLFPYKHIAAMEEALIWSVDQVSRNLPWYYRYIEGGVPDTKAVEWANSTDRYLMSVVGPNNHMMIRVVDYRGDVYNEWLVDWFKIWPDATHLPASKVPKMQPGSTLHGLAMLENGDVIFNIEVLGLFRMTPCGDVVWKLPYRTHHSIFPDEQGNFWVTGKITHEKSVPEYPNHKPSFHEPTLLRVSPDGEILREISVFELLDKNDLRALLHMVTANNSQTAVSGDTLHLNDVDVFPSTMEEGLFRHGDIMISLRNISTVLVFDPENLTIRYIKTGGFVRQHDPDFLDGNTYSVFDNNNIAPKAFGQQSRILIVAADTGDVTTWYEGSVETPFYTNVMGKHEWIGTDEMLIAESTSGRAFRVNSDGDILWDYFNKVDNDVVGILSDVLLLPDSLSGLYATAMRDRCKEEPSF